LERAARDLDDRDSAVFQDIERLSNAEAEALLLKELDDLLP
jgi:hypothetical protein